MTSLYEAFHTFLTYWFPDSILNEYPDIFVWCSVGFTLFVAFMLVKWIFSLPKWFRKL